MRHPGKYRLRSPVSIGDAYRRAGGWTGEGSFGGMPSKTIRLVQHHNGQETRTNVRINIDPETKKMLVLDKEWKNYALVDGDEVGLPTIYF